MGLQARNRGEGSESETEGEIFLPIIWTQIQCRNKNKIDQVVCGHQKPVDILVFDDHMCKYNQQNYVGIRLRVFLVLVDILVLIHYLEKNKFLLSNGLHLD